MTRFAQMNARLLARYGGTITLARTTPGTVDPSQPWVPVQPVTVSEQVLFIVQAAAVEWVNAGLILAGDLVGTMAVPATLNPPLPGDTITAGGKTYTLLRAEPVDSEPGEAIHFTVQGRV